MESLALGAIALFVILPIGTALVLAALVLPLGLFLLALWGINALFGEPPSYNLDQLTREELEVLSGWIAYGC